MKKHIIFDFDGTLVDSMDTSISVINQLAAKYKVKPLTHEDITELRKLPIIDRCKKLNFPLYRIPFAIIEFYKYYRGAVSKLQLFDGIKELLGKLIDNGFELAIISSNSQENIMNFLRENNINSIHKVITSNNIFGKDKELQKYLDTYKLHQSDVIYVGDELRDIIACKQVGIKIIWVPWGFDAIEVTKKERPDYFAKIPNDILTIAKANLK